MKVTVNPNKEVVEKIRKAVYDNQGHCPCALEKTEDTICMCKDFINKKEDGWCNCGLYYKKVD